MHTDKLPRLITQHLPQAKGVAQQIISIKIIERLFIYVSELLKFTSKLSETFDRTPAGLVFQTPMPALLSVKERVLITRMVTTPSLVSFPGELLLQVMQIQPLEHIH